MVALVLFDQFLIDRGNGLHNMGSDTFKVAFSDTAPDKATNTVLADVAEIAAGGGYPTGGLVLTITGWTQVSGLATWNVANLSFTPSGDVGPFRYIIIYNSTAAGGPLVGYYDRGSEITLTATGDPFVLYYSLSPILLREKQVALF